MKSKHSRGLLKRWQLYGITAAAMLSFAAVTNAGSNHHGHHHGNHHGNHHSLLKCDVAIVGGGPGGVHTAYKLTQLGAKAGVDPQRVCLFEKNDQLGGRIVDKPVGQGGALTGTGAYRMYSTHYTTRLYEELLNKPIDDLINDGVIERSIDFSATVAVQTPNDGIQYSNDGYGDEGLAQFFPSLINPGEVVLFDWTV